MGRTVSSSSLYERYVRSPAAQARSLERVSHRPWPLRPGPWVMGQTWRHLLQAQAGGEHEDRFEAVMLVLSAESADVGEDGR